MPTIMNTEQFTAYRKAVKSGDKVKAKRIWDSDSSVPYVDFDVEAEIIEDKPELIKFEEPIVWDEDDVMSDVSAGMDNKEICKKYGISSQKLGAIKRRAK